jgi:hypothetical protein
VCGLEKGAHEQVPDAVLELRGLLRIGDLLHPFRHSALRDDLGAFEELVSPDVVRVLMRVDDASGHRLPDLPEQLDHLPRVPQVRLGVDDDAATQVDEA